MDKRQVVIIVLTILLVGSVAINLIQYRKAQYIQLEQSLDKLEFSVEKLKLKAEILLYQTKYINCLADQLYKR